MEVLDLASKVKAEIVDSSLLARPQSLLVRLGASLNKAFGLGLLAFQRRREFDLIYVGNEKLGLVVATLFKFVKRRPRIAILNHYLSSPKKATLFSRLQLHTSIDALICLNEYQASFLQRELAVPPRKVFRIHYGAAVDGDFFLPQLKEGERQNYVLSVGRENRDYETLFEALRTSEVRAKIVSSGLGAPGDYKNHMPAGQPIENVEMLEHVSYAALRNLYDGCCFVVIPLHNVDYPAGITAVMEAMAMGKAVIATYSRGIEEFIDDAVTGFWTEPANPIQLRDKILLLWNNPKLAIQMGQRARESVKSRVDMTRYVEELQSILTTCKQMRHST